MTIITIKAKSLRGACALAKNQGFTHIAWAVRCDGIWEVVPCRIAYSDFVFKTKG